MLLQKQLLLPPELILDDDVEEDGDTEEADENVEFNGNAHEGAEDEGHRSTESLKESEILEGYLLLIRTAQTHQA